jgi:hypothetical protein
MPKVLTEQQVRDFEEQGYLSRGARRGIPREVRGEDSRYAPSEAYGGQRAAT